MKPEENPEMFVISSSPHAHSGETVQRIMLDVLIALVPAFAASCWFFGWQTVRVTATCVITCMVVEWLCRKLMKRENSLSDLSAIITGVLLAFNLPPTIPTWMAVAGSAFAIAIAKQVFGGLGYNPFNPALAGRAFMLFSFTGAMTTWTEASWIQKASCAAANAATDLVATTSATPLGMIKEAAKAGDAIPQFSMSALSDFFLGANLNGCLGETSALALLIGAAYLLYRKVISWHIPVAFLGTVLVYATIVKLVSPTAVCPLFHLLSGGLFLGAFFMATDMVTTPITKKGMLVFGIGCGIITMVIRTSKTGAYPEGVSFAILIMNALTPLINRATRNRVFGTTKKAVKK